MNRLLNNAAEADLSVDLSCWTPTAGNPKGIDQSRRHYISSTLAFLSFANSSRNGLLRSPVRQSLFSFHNRIFE
jgi:hypothetical protein